MVIILSDSRNAQPFETPRQLTKINGEPLVARTIRLLKENGINDIIITSHDKRFDNLGAERYEPKNNIYEPFKETGYWLNAFPLEILTEPTIYLFGDVYYSENAIKTILETPTDDILFFCTYKNQDPRYIKHHDEPMAYKVVNIDKFKEHIQKVKDAKDKGLCCREPVTWELYRSINNQELNIHTMTKGYVAINDESCDIDSINDIVLLERKLGGIKMIKARANQDFSLERFNELKNIQRFRKEEEGKIFKNDIFECEEDLADYLSGNNKLNIKVIDIIEVIPVPAITAKEEPKYEKDPIAGETKAVKPKIGKNIKKTKKK